MEGTVFYIDLKEKKPTDWVVYTLHDSKGEMQWIGECHLKSLMYIPDARKHAMFGKVFHIDNPVQVKIQKLFTNKTDCIVWKNRFLTTIPRPFMMSYQATYRSKVRLRCVETGEEFDSITECAEKHGVSASAVSNNLSGNPSYLTVKGLSYEYLI